MNTVAAVQMISSPSVADNIATARRLIGHAADTGAELVLLPEYWAIMGQSDTDKVAQAEHVGRYDKIHLFGFSKGTEAYDEARTIVPGSHVGTMATPLGKVGLSVCYDLRFPELYRAMGPCALIVVPAAFTYTTGQAHWEVLLRARAIENQCYVLAAAQGGLHPNGRRTWGHSMLIDPWGEIKAIHSEGEGVVHGDIDSVFMDNVRASLPALKHRTM